MSGLYGPTAAADRLRLGVYNVKDYGATGDGATDDYPAIAAAIAAIPAAGGTLSFPPGTYVVSADPTIGGSNITVRGAGWGSVIKAKAATSANCLKITGTNVTVENLAVDGNRANQPTGITYTQRSGIFTLGATNVTIRNCLVAHTGSAGVMAENTAVIKILDNTVTDTGDGGIFLHPDGNNPSCSFARIAGNTVSYAAYYGITAIRCDYVTIVDNEASFCGQTDPSQGAGLDLEGSRYCVIANNKSHDNHGGIVVRVTLEGGASQRCLDIAIVGNTLRNNTPSGVSGEASIQVDNTDSIAIVGNHCSLSNQGINIGNASDVLVSGNLSTGHTNSGIRFYSTAATGSLVVVGNTVKGNSNCGVMLLAPGVVVEDNDVFLNTNNGINLDTGAQNCNIANNRIADNSNNGIELDGTSGNLLVRGNLFTNAASGGQGRALYEATGAGPTTFTGNTTVGVTNEDFHFSHASSMARNNIAQNRRDEHSGTGTMAVATASIAITHGLWTTPVRVTITPTSDPQQRYWISAKTATTFTVTAAANIATTAFVFDWRAYTYDA